ncbi:phage head closure protein [Pseudogemmobacter faecipullorum]|uniref:Phage head closure protein n=1 Tax=Pseudogemmobacter faecipullorum TaxID=2755041 RepID=A0ABS8CR92_9RHOB|nr:phage head closure protein [Pseudogemmobacter faecipullorum]MCB5411884.1 phage head closure protein [Pseudogemmobacter faecipullorum]
MMRAGKLQHRIELQRLSESLGPNRQAVQTWTTYASGKAELRQSGLSEFLTTFGEGMSNNAVFLLRWLPGVAVSDRILHGGKVWNIVAIAEIGRRKGIELRAVAA